MNNMEFAFPTVAVIRKGTAKRKGKNREGKEIEVVGSDLKDKLRIAWAPGTERHQARWKEVYGSSYEVKEIHAMLPFGKVWDSLQIFNEAYQAGRMVVRANDRQVLVKRDPLTGKYLVRDGDPYEEYIPGEPVTYTRDGKSFTLPIRTSIRLKLFLPELMMPVQMVLKSTSYYDAVNLRQQMGAIQLLADQLNAGIAGGIPIIVYRQSTEVTWNKKDGSAARVPQWLINVQVDERWLKAAIQRMSAYALTGQHISGLLQPPEEIAGTEDPNQGIDDPEEEPEVIEGQAVEVQEEGPAEPEMPPHPAEVEQPQPEQAAQPELTPAGERAQLTPDAAKDRYLDKVNHWQQQKVQEAPALRKQINRILQDILDGTAIHAQENKHVAANTLLFWLTGFRDLDHIPMEYVRALKTWMKPEMADNERGYEIDPISERELLNCYRQATGLELE